jgi:hypothetical protein
MLSYVVVVVLMLLLFYVVVLCCVNVVVSQAMALVRQETRVKEEESRDSMNAALFAKQSPAALTDKATKARNVTLERVRATNYLGVVAAKAGELLVKIDGDADEIIKRLLTLYTEELPEYANKARNELLAVKNTAVEALNRGKMYVKELVEKARDMEGCGELDQARKMADDFVKGITKGDVGPYTRMLRAFKKMLVAVEREQKLLGAEAQKPPEMGSAPVSPLFTMLTALVAGGDINTGPSLFEAKQGHRAALLIPKARLGRV